MSIISLKLITFTFLSPLISVSLFEITMPLNFKDKDSSKLRNFNKMEELLLRISIFFFTSSTNPSRILSLTYYLHIYFLSTHTHLLFTKRYRGGFYSSDNLKKFELTFKYEHKSYMTDLA